MPWWGWLIIGGAVFVAVVTVAVLVLVFGVFRTVKGEFDQTWKNVNGPLWGADFEKRPGGRDNFPRGPYGSGR
jgi:Flp pilus assembly pilin Flp